MEWWKILASAIVFDYVYFKLKYVRPKGPPVYYGLPFIGFAFMRLLPPSWFKKLFKIYLEKAPDVIIVRLPAACALLKHNANKEMQLNPDCLPRPRLNFTDILSWAATGTTDWTFFDGVRTSKADQWQTSRKIGIAAVYAGPKNKMIAKMSDTADAFLKDVEEHEGRDWNPEISLMLSKFHEIIYLFFGAVFKTEDMEGYATRLISSASVFNSVIILFKLVPVALFRMVSEVFYPIVRFGYWSDVYKNFLWRIYQEHSASHAEDDSRDYVAAIAASRKDSPDLLYYLREVTFTSFHVATHTTWHTVLSVLSYCAVNPEKQQRLYEEIIHEVGRGEVTTDTLDRMHYLKAVITEALRLNPAVAFPYREAKNWTTIGGYEIPQGMTIVPVVHSENFDPADFPEPEKFQPERFLDAKGFFFHDPNLGTFSRGKRACPGKNFSYTSASVYLVKILRRFSLEPTTKDAEIREYLGEFFTAAGRLDELRFIRREGAPPIRDVQLNTKLSRVLREIMAAEDKKRR